MPSRWPWNLPQRRTDGYVKKLEGIRLDLSSNDDEEELCRIVDVALSSSDNDEHHHHHNNNNSNGNHHHDNEQHDKNSTAQNAIHRHHSEEECVVALKEFRGKLRKTMMDEGSSSSSSSTTTILLPLSTLRVMYYRLDKSPADMNTLNQLLAGSKKSNANPSPDENNDDGTMTTTAAAIEQRLAYTQPPSKVSLSKGELAEQAKFQKRMARLRLKQEEFRYRKLTQNLDTTVEDDVTTKSMTYAASVGLNMIVAPISFGVFMYFFAGQIFGWILRTGGDHDDDDGDYEDENAVRATATDIRRVIAGVVSGVIMLFIEMILFVIRSHEFDTQTTKKKRRKEREGLSPFGYQKPKSMTTAHHRSAEAAAAAAAANETSNGSNKANGGAATAVAVAETTKAETAKLSKSD